MIHSFMQHEVRDRGENDVGWNDEDEGRSNSSLEIYEWLVVKQSNLIVHCPGSYKVHKLLISCLTKFQ